MQVSQPNNACKEESVSPTGKELSNIKISSPLTNTNPFAGSLARAKGENILLPETFK